MTDKVNPVPEHFAGTVMPGGRGIEQHGVPAHGAPELVEAWEEGDPIEYPEPKAEPVPVPVRIVQGDEGRELLAFRALTVPLQAGVPTQILPRNLRRKSATIRVAGPLTAPNVGLVSLIPRATFTAMAGVTDGPVVTIPAGSQAWVMTRVYTIAGAGAGAQGSILDADPITSGALSTVVAGGVLSATGVNRSSVSGTTTATGLARGRITWSGTVDSADMEVFAYVTPPAGWTPDATTYLGAEPPNSLTGYRLDNGGQIAVTTEEPVFAMSPVGAMVQVLVEYGK